MSKSKKSEFSPNEYVVYPAHGVGKIISIEEQEIAGISLELFVISFEKDKIIIKHNHYRRKHTILLSEISEIVLDQEKSC